MSEQLIPWSITHSPASTGLGVLGYGTYVITENGDRLCIDFQDVHYAKRIEHVPLPNGNVRSTVVEWFDPKPKPTTSELAKLVAAAPAMKKALTLIASGNGATGDMQAIAHMALELTKL